MLVSIKFVVLAKDPFMIVFFCDLNMGNILRALD
jgi:hypothetical protein